jgi:hypothetical protein
VETGVAARTLKSLAAQLASIPDGFAAHKTAAKLAQSRSLEADGPVDWALAELLAYASLVEEGDMVRKVWLAQEIDLPVVLKPMRTQTVEMVFSVEEPLAGKINGYRALLFYP